MAYDGSRQMDDMKNERITAIDMKMRELAKRRLAEVSENRKRLELSYQLACEDTRERRRELRVATYAEAGCKRMLENLIRGEERNGG